MKNLRISNFFPFIFLQSFLFKNNKPVIRLSTVFILLEKKKLCELTRYPVDLLAQLIMIAQDNYYDLKFNRLYSDMKRIINLCGKTANWKKMLADCLIIKERDH